MSEDLGRLAATATAGVVVVFVALRAAAALRLLTAGVLTKGIRVLVRGVVAVMGVREKRTRETRREDC